MTYPRRHRVRRNGNVSNIATREDSQGSNQGGAEACLSPLPKINFWSKISRNRGADFNINNVSDDAIFFNNSSTEVS